jgi:superfamily II DNA/RNA helicase
VNLLVATPGRLLDHLQVRLLEPSEGTALGLTAATSRTPGGSCTGT